MHLAAHHWPEPPPQSRVQGLVGHGRPSSAWAGRDPFGRRPKAYVPIMRSNGKFGAFPASKIEVMKEDSPLRHLHAGATGAGGERGTGGMARTERRLGHRSLTNHTPLSQSAAIRVPGP